MITEAQLQKFDEVLPLSKWKSELTVAEFDFLSSAGLLKDVSVSELVGLVGFFQIENSHAEYEIVKKSDDYYLCPTDFSDVPIKLENDQLQFAKLDWKSYLQRLKGANNLTQIHEAFKSEKSMDYVGSRIVNGKKSIHFFAKTHVTLADLERIGSFIGLNKKDGDFVVLTSNVDVFFSKGFNQAFKEHVSLGRLNQVNSQFKIEPSIIYSQHFKFSLQEIISSCGADVLVAEKASHKIYLGEKEIAKGETDTVKMLLHLMENPNVDVTIQEIVHDVLKKSDLQDVSKTVRDIKEKLLTKLKNNYGETSPQHVLMRDALTRPDKAKYGHARLDTEKMFVLVI